MQCGFIIRPDYEFLTPVISEWIACIDKYARWHDGGDLPYWYNERANVSVLTGAAWRANFVALEEYQVDKFKETAPNGKSLGRNDLYLSSEEESLCIEAKVCYPNMANTAESKTCIEAAIGVASSDAKNLRGDVEEKLGAVFVVPYSENKVATNEQTNAFIAAVGGFQSPIKAWCFPSNAQKIVGKYDRYCPGVALLIG